MFGCEGGGGVQQSDIMPSRYLGGGRAWLGRRAMGEKGAYYFVKLGTLGLIDNKRLLWTIAVNQMALL